MAKTKSYIGIKNESKDSTLELHFTDYIYDGFDWETWEMTNLVQETINKIKDANPSKIKVVINSLGGDVMVGLALYNYIKNHKAEKEVEIIGFAASIASVMAMCADPGKLKMAKNAFMIIHAAWSYAAGNAAEIREQADTLDMITNELADIYAQRSGKTAKHYTNLWKNGDYWMTGTEAKAEGLVDELFNSEPVKAGLDFTAHNFKHIPSGLIAASVEKPEENHKTFFSNLKSDFMNILDQLKAAIKGGKENPKFENVASRNEVLDMVEEVLSPILAQMDEKDKGAGTEETKTEKETTTSTSTEKAGEKGAEESTEKKETTTTTKTGDDDAKAEIEKLKAENKKLKAAAAAKATKPEDDDVDAKKTKKLANVRISYAKDDDDVIVEDEE